MARIPKQVLLTGAACDAVLMVFYGTQALCGAFWMQQAYQHVGRTLCLKYAERASKLSTSQFCVSISVHST
jgi:hypothetical protein